MAWSDRRYGLENLNPSDDRPLGTYWLIGVTLGVSILIWIFAPLTSSSGRFGQVVEIFAVHTDHLLELWRPVTYLLIHGGVGHIFFNMLLLYFMGRMLESHFGTRRFVTLYVCFGIAGAIGIGLEYAIPPHDTIKVIGASGAVMGLVGLLGGRFPMVQIMLWGVIAMRGWVLAAILIGLDVLSVIAYRGDGLTSHSAHLGGAFAGVLYGLGWSRFASRLDDLKAARDDRKARREKERKTRDNLEMDRILEKINELGMDKLSESERSFLLQQSERLKDRHKQF